MIDHVPVNGPFKKTIPYSLPFNCRKDVFAIHWQKPALSSGGGNKSGYMPAYHYDPYRYRMHKIKGGSFKDYKDKTHLPLTDQQILKHLDGDQLMGIYPLARKLSIAERKTYFGIGFKNDSGGFENRNPCFKVSSTPKEMNGNWQRIQGPING